MLTMDTLMKSIVVTWALLLICVQYTEGKGAIFLSKEESHQVLKGGHTALSELEGWETYYEDIYTNKVHFGTGAGLTHQMETLVKRGIISPRVREQMLDTLTASAALGLQGVSQPERTQSVSSSTPQKDTILGVHHGSLTSRPIH